MTKYRGQLYIFEGIDNVGKTTIISELCSKLNKDGISFSNYSFPGKEPQTLGDLVCQLHNKSEKYLKNELDPLSIQLLHIAAHIDTINSNILPDLKAGKIVLLDRSWWSTYAYGLASGISKKAITQIIKPEIDILKYVPCKIFLIKRNLHSSEYNEEKINTILNSYEELNEKYRKSNLVEVVDNNNDLSLTINKIYKTIGNHEKYKLNIQKSIKVIPSSIYKIYWEFAKKRQDIFFNRINGEYPWTSDPILKKYKFTNSYRASDRVSQFLLKHVIYNNVAYSPEDTFFRIILFKLFNKIETWLRLEESLGEITYHNYSYEKYDEFFTRLLVSKEKIYSAAYIMPSGKGSYGYDKKHRNNLKLLEMMMKDNITRKIAKAKKLEQVYQLFLSYPTIGKFLAFQYSIDINYSELCDFNENSFVVAGPGAINGIHKCFNSIGFYSPEDIIRFMTDKQIEEFERLKLDFKDLWGRPLHLIDCQNLFCEFDKYTRVAFPDEKNGRRRIKQLFTANSNKIEYFYPPKWEINYKIDWR